MEQALLPSTDVCTWCRGRGKLDSRLLLCASCRGQIPWINEVCCPTCGRYEACYDCKRRKETFFVASRSAVRYDARMKEWLSNYKYRGNERLHGLFAEMLHHAFRMHTEPSAGKEAARVLTYVPVSEERYRERGFNQAERLAAGLEQRCRIPVYSLLKRTRHTDKQSFKKRSDRLGDLEGAFTTDPDGMREMTDRFGSTAAMEIYIVDDVYTTGSTLNQCARVIKSSLPSEVYGLCWAR